MLDQVIKRAYYLNKHLEAPLLKERQDYLQHWASKGVCQHTLKSIADYLLRIVQFLHLQNDGTITLEAVEKAGSAWAKFQFNHPMKKSFLKQEKRDLSGFLWIG